MFVLGQTCRVCFERASLILAGVLWVHPPHSPAYAALLVAYRTSIDCEIDAILKDLPTLEKDTEQVRMNIAACSACMHWCPD